MLDESNFNVKHILHMFDYPNTMKLLKNRIAFAKSITGWSNAELARQAGVSRTAPTDWLKGDVGVLSSPVAQRLSTKTPFTANWLATGEGDMYKAATESERGSEHRAKKWPFRAINERKVQKLSSNDLIRLETALLAFAQRYRLDIATDQEQESPPASD